MSLRLLRPTLRVISLQSKNRLLYTSTIHSKSESAANHAPTSSSSSLKPKWSKHIISTTNTIEPEPEQRNDTITAEKKRSGSKKRKRRVLKPLKSPITLTPNALIHLRALNSGPVPQLIRISVQNRGCSGLAYHLEYVSKPEKFDEVVEQDGVKIIIDSKALFSIIGSEMDWLDDKLSSKFVFKNPNSKGTCGCGESFMV